VLASWTEAATPTGGCAASSRRTGRTRPGGRRPPGDVRQCAREQGYEVSVRGCIQADIVGAHQDAHR
jgi:hypothetical protein